MFQFHCIHAHIICIGAETAPRSTSARILMGGWWFVCLILGATYTANLTAIFAIEDNTSDVPDSIDELVSKIPPDIPFGAYNNTQASEYFQFSAISRYQEAFQYMQMEGLLFETEDEALSAVLHDNVALIDDGPLVEFVLSRRGPYNPDCTLKSIGDGRFSPVGYALGLTKNSPFTDDFSLAILELREQNEIENIRAEYFDHRRTCVSEVAVTSASFSRESEKLNIEQFYSLFIVLGIAVIISLIALLAEHTLYKYKDKIQTMIVKRFHTQDQKEESETLADSQEGVTSTEL